MQTTFSALKTLIHEVPLCQNMNPIINWFYKLFGLKTLMKPQKPLLVLDFDGTMIDNSCLLKINALFKKEVTLDEFPDFIDYFRAMAESMKEAGVTKEVLERELATIPLNPGVRVLVQTSYDQGYEIVVISDNTTLFVEIHLKAAGIRGLNKEILAHPAKFKHDGCAIREPYMNQKTCHFRHQHLCKGIALDDYVKSKKDVKISRVIYAGDSVNDFCPMVVLNENDLACVK